MVRFDAIEAEILMLIREGARVRTDLQSTDIEHNRYSFPAYENIEGRRDKERVRQLI